MRVNSLSVLPNGNLASVSDDQTIKIWNPYTGVLIATLNANTPLCGSILLKNGNLLSGGCSGIMQEWSLSEGIKKTLHTHTRSIYFFTYLQNGYLVSGGEGELFMWS
jgi:WD40 repeat protein